ncbi:uncharacterized protein LOC132157549 [Carassius carassius]|uniref:uncharacterized protein LOC132157549 n=1 Tax=Carassius carassius TaxID=217509 RepID=UPI002869635C|nr:uncharacterized protein LOC132157549 [Carassius carassius]
MTVGGATGTICNIINDTQQKHLRETIEKITSDFQNTINAMFENVSTIIHSTEDIQQLVQQEINDHKPARMIQAGGDQMRGFSAISGLPKAEMPSKSQGAKQFDTAVCWTKGGIKGFQLCSGAVKKISSSSEAVKNFHLTSAVSKTTRLSSGAVKTARVSAQTAKAARSAAAVSGSSLEFFTNKPLDLRGCGVLTESKTIKSRELDLALFTLAITKLG